MARSRSRSLRPVPDVETRVCYREIHGYRRAFRIAGEGPALLLIHGIGDSSGGLGRNHPAPGETAHRDRARPARPRPLRQAPRRLLRRRIRERHARSAGGTERRARHDRRAFARRRRRDAVRLPVPATRRAPRAGVVERDHQARTRDAAADLGAGRQRVDGPAQAAGWAHRGPCRVQLRRTTRHGRRRPGGDAHPHPGHHARRRRTRRPCRVRGVPALAAGSRGLARTGDHAAGPLLSQRRRPGADRVGWARQHLPRRATRTWPIRRCRDRGCRCSAGAGTTRSGTTHSGSCEWWRTSSTPPLPPATTTTVGAAVSSTAWARNRSAAARIPEWRCWTRWVRPNAAPHEHDRRATATHVRARDLPSRRSRSARSTATVARSASPATARRLC